MAAIAMAHRRARDRKWTDVAADVGEQLKPEPAARFFERAGPGPNMMGSTPSVMGVFLRIARVSGKADSAFGSKTMPVEALFSKGLSFT